MEKISRKDLAIAWLAGMMDADGCISFAKQVENRRGEKTYHLVPYASITTTCATTSTYLVELYKELQIPVYVALKNNGDNCKPVYVFTTRGMKRIKILLALISQYLVTKNEEANLIKEFIDIRERLFATKTHDDREYGILEEMKRLKSERNIVRNPQRLYARTDYR